MSDDVKKIRKVARCIQTMVEAEGEKVTAKQIMGLIQGKDVSDIVSLKDFVLENVSELTGNDLPSIRRSVLKDFIVANWEAVRDNEVVKSVLFNGYCMGRYSKEERVTMLNNLLTFVEETEQTL